MSETAFAGPLIVYGSALAQGGLGNAQDYNPMNGAPSMIQGGGALLDPRLPFTYQPGQRQGQPVYGFLNNLDWLGLDIVPYTIAVGAVAPAANTTSGTAMTLGNANGFGVTVGNTITNSATGALVTGLMCVSVPSAGIAFGATSQGMLLWDPGTLTARALSVTGASGGAGGAFLVKGYDIYNYPMSETITATSGATSVNGKKAWKYIASITPQFSDAHNYSFQLTDIFGFPVYENAASYVSIYYPQPTLITSATGFVAGDTTTATSTTGDVRGTYALQSASNNVNRLIAFFSVTPSNMKLGLPGLFGVTQA